MKRLHHIWIAALGAAVLLGALALSPSRATAQPFVWDPPCTFTKITNATPCAAILTVNTTAGPVGPFGPVPAGGSLIVPMGPAPVTVFGITTQAGAIVPTSTVPVVIPSPPAAPGTIATGWVRNVTLGPPPGCCFDVYFDASGAPGCWIWLVPAVVPPPCTP